MQCNIQQSAAMSMFNNCNATAPPPAPIVLHCSALDCTAGQHCTAVHCRTGVSASEMLRCCFLAAKTFKLNYAARQKCKSVAGGGAEQLSGCTFVVTLLHFSTFATLFMHDLLCKSAEVLKEEGQTSISVYFGLIYFTIWTNIFCTLDKYFLQFGLIHFTIWTCIFCTLVKYILQFGQIHFTI